MFYVYDQAVCEDLDKSFNRDEDSNPVVKVCPPDQVIAAADQIKEGQNLFPLVAVSRSDDVVIDTDRSNFSRLHKGVSAVMDLKTNELYYEKVIPVRLSYTLTILTTNTADMDELVRELLFKYADMYFLTIRLPYEADRKIRFGLALDQSSTVTRESYLSEYVNGGSVYQSSVVLNCEGCVLVNYTSAKLKRFAMDDSIGLGVYQYDENDGIGFSVTANGVKRDTAFAQTVQGTGIRNQALDVTVQGDGRRSQGLDVTVQGSPKRGQGFGQTVSGDGRRSEGIDVTVQGDPKRSSSFGQTVKGSEKRSSSFGQTVYGDPGRSSSFGQTVYGDPKRSSSFGQTVQGDPKRSSAFGQTVYGDPTRSSSFGQTVQGDAKRSSSFGQTVQGDAKRSSSFGQTVKGNSLRSSSFGQTVQGDSLRSSSFGQTVQGSKLRSMSFDSTVQGSPKRSSSFKSTIQKRMPERSSSFDVTVKGRINRSSKLDVTMEDYSKSRRTSVSRQKFY